MKFIFTFILIITSILFSKEYKRIISLAPSFSKQIYLLGAEDRLIANTTYCDFSEDSRKKEKIGNLVQINVEKIISLNPDLVLASTMTKPNLLKKLENLGISVKIIKTATNFNKICDQIINIGKYCGKLDSAKQIVKQVKFELEKIKNITKDFKKKKVFMQVGAKPLFTVIKNTFVDEMITLGGGENVVTQTNTGIYSREKVIEKNPEFIIIATMGIVGKKESSAWKKYTSIEAVKNDNIFIVDSYKYLSPGPFQFVEAVKGMLHILHPDVKIEK